jgi:hypothetical protein
VNAAFSFLSSIGHIFRRSNPFALSFSVSPFTFEVPANDCGFVPVADRYYSYQLMVHGYSPIEMILLAAPITTLFRLSEEDSGFFVKLTIGETDSAMTTIFEPALLPYPYMIINQLSHDAIFAQQGEHSMPFRVLPRSSSFFAFDARFAELAIVLTISGKSQLVPLHDDARGSYLPFTINADRIIVDLVTLSNGTRALIVGLHPDVKPSTSLLLSLR